MVENKPQKLMSKDNNFFDHIKSLIENSGKLSSLLVRSIVGSSHAGIYEDSRSVYKRSSLVHWMVLMKLLNIATIHKGMKGEFGSLLNFGKDVLYSVKNSCRNNWRKVLLNQSFEKIGGIELEPKNGAAFNTPCFIIDDTDMMKRGKHIEWIGRIFSHVTHSYDLGYKSLNLAYWSGKHLVHVDMSFHIEKGKKGNQGMKAKELKERYSKGRPEHCHGHIRITELVLKKTKVAISMLGRAIRKGFKAQYILADSWFFNTELAKFAKRHKVHLISRPKFNNWKYVYKGKAYTIGQLVKKLRYSKDKKWNRRLRMHFVVIRVEFNGIPLQLFIYKEKKRGTKWCAIVSTDLQISAQRVFQIYQNRWTIETSYKELKQHLKFGKCMSRDFDGQIADATLILMAYNLLSHIKALDDHQSIGYLFDKVSKNMLLPTIMQKFWNSFYKAIKEIAEMIQKPVDDLISIAINQVKFLKTISDLNLILTTET
jgi:hypothetical protein